MNEATGCFKIEVQEQTSEVHEQDCLPIEYNKFCSHSGYMVKESNVFIIEHKTKMESRIAGITSEQALWQIIV